jgi:hypothetical protein
MDDMKTALQEGLVARLTVIASPQALSFQVDTADSLVNHFPAGS